MQANSVRVEHRTGNTNFTKIQLKEKDYLSEGTNAKVL